MINVDLLIIPFYPSSGDMARVLWQAKWMLNAFENMHSTLRTFDRTTTAWLFTTWILFTMLYWLIWRRFQRARWGETYLVHLFALSFPGCYNLTPWALEGVGLTRRGSAWTQQNSLSAEPPLSPLHLLPTLMTSEVRREEANQERRGEEGGRKNDRGREREKRRNEKSRTLIL